MSNLNYPLYPEYTLDYINSIMSLRKPQSRSLQILDVILNDNVLSKDIDIDTYQRSINDVYPIFKQFERPFFNLAFELATGVGKTKLMGAFITYLYTNKGVRNFFVVAPSLTIYNKLKNDLGNPSISNEKYVFRGVSCFTTSTPSVWADEDYKNHPESSFALAESINIFIFNISKFNSEGRKMMSVNEYLGKSFFDYLKSLNDLVVIMDESHHYRANASSVAINLLNPILGIELTATPYTTTNTKQHNFKNVVYEYELKKAILDGYTRTPYAITRQNMQKIEADENQMDLIMLNDGLKHHKNMKLELYQYHKNTDSRLVKPFMLVVCKDTTHAENIVSYIKSNNFSNGEYKDKVVVVHSNQRGAEKDENVQLLLDVEKTENPIEIVVHVNILKEGWDVNNLYTIVPLRTATSKILREQTVGRGLRLPFGKRTDEIWIDSVAITAHDKFDEIIAEAQRGDSIFKKDGVIYSDLENEKRVVHTQLRAFDDNELRGQVLERAGLTHNKTEDVQAYNTLTQNIRQVAVESKQNNPTKRIDVEELKKLLNERDLYRKQLETQITQEQFDTMFRATAEVIVNDVETKSMYIPQLMTKEFGEEEYIIKPFNLDFSRLVYYPVTDINLIKKNLFDSRAATVVEKDIDIILMDIKPEKRLVDGIRQINEIDYEKATDAIQRVVKEFLVFYRNKFTEKEVRNICTMFIKDIIEQLKKQLLENLAIMNVGMIEEVSDIQTTIINNVIDETNGRTNIHVAPQLGISIKSLVYEGARKSVVEPFKFDSNPERVFALACENSPEVIQWLRPASKQFNLTYNRTKHYRPDFVVETTTDYYLVEIKGKNMLNDPDVLAKKQRAIEYCKVASEYNLAHGHKPFTYLFIPEDQFESTTSFNVLRERFRVL